VLIDWWDRLSSLSFGAREQGVATDAILKEAALNRVLTILPVWIAVWVLVAPAGVFAGFGGVSDLSPLILAQAFPGRVTARGENNSVAAFAVFDEAMRLTKQHYADPIDEGEALGGTLARLMLSLPPHCAEDLGDCPGSAQSCFKEALRRIAELCGFKTERLVVRAVNIFMQSLDANSSLMDAEALKELKIGTSGKFGGVGMVVNPKDGDYVVISPFEGTPAFKAGIKPGDIILEIDGQPLHGLPLTEVLRRVRGPAGSTIIVKIRESKTGNIRQIRMHRQIIRIPTVRYVMIRPGIAYMRIKNFQENAPRDVEAALNRINAATHGRLKGMILDLRDNPGGLFDEAIDVADLLIPSGRITSVMGRNSGLNREFRASGQTRFRMPPTVVLINKGTASASEILAGALQGRPNVVVMGERSFGKASVQAVFPVRQGMALRITTAHYYTADSRDIDGKGLEPDISLGENPDEITERIDALRNDQLETDPWIREALEYLSRGVQPSSATASSLY
jgi:carboxyl-terminal processing protease